MSEYKIKLEIFEGPIALLLHLIEKNQLDIYDIPIAEVTEQYLAYLEALEEFNIDIATEFLVMAATLLQIKSRMLLPTMPKAQESTEELDDPRQELVDKLLEYRKFKQIAANFEDMINERDKFYTRLPQEFTAKLPVIDELKMDDLIKAFLAVWESSLDDYAVVSRENISVQDKIQDIINLLHKSTGTIEFSMTIIRTGTRSEVIAAFLALLELIKLKRVAICQKESFAPIYIKLKE